MHHSTSFFCCPLTIINLLASPCSPSSWASLAILTTHASYHILPLMSFNDNLYFGLSLQPFKLGVTPNNEAQLRAMIAASRLRNPDNRQVCAQWHLFVHVPVHVPFVHRWTHFKRTAAMHLYKLVKTCITFISENLRILIHP